jgi:hydroxymethylglutaryl-CoA reductase (NADPH)
MSLCLGIYAANISGGTVARHFRQELSRAPVFIFDNIDESMKFQNWVKANEKEIINVAESTTSHGKVLRIDQYTVQNYVILDIVLNTSNAAGQKYGYACGPGSLRVYSEENKSEQYFRIKFK